MAMFLVFAQKAPMTDFHQILHSIEVVDIITCEKFLAIG